MGSVGVRTAAGGVMSLEIMPADVIGRCDQCLKIFREGDWYCDHLAARHGHPIGWLSDQPGHASTATAQGAWLTDRRPVNSVPVAAFLGLDEALRVSPRGDTA